MIYLYHMLSIIYQKYYCSRCLFDCIVSLTHLPLTPLSYIFFIFFSCVQGLAPSIPTEFNFGIQRSFAFDVIAFEEQQLIEAFGTHPPSSTTHPHIHNNSNSRSSISSSGSGSSPGNVSGHTDPWRYYETLAEEQEAKQWVPRHPKYRNSRWDPSNRSNDGNTTAIQQKIVPMSVIRNSSIDVVAVAALSSSLSSSSSSSVVRNSFIFPQSTYLPSDASNDTGMNVNADGNTFSADVTNYSTRDRSGSTVSISSTRTGRGGRERGRGGDFLLAKRQYAYISRSAKLERLTTIISATNAPYVSPTRRGLPGSSANNYHIQHNEKQNKAVDEKKIVSVSREKTVQEKGKRKRKSLFLNPDLRAATLAEISNTSRVSFVVSLLVVNHIVLIMDPSPF